MTRTFNSPAVIARTETRRKTMHELRDVLENHYSEGYEAVTDGLADESDHAEAVDALGKALRTAVDALTTTWDV